MVEFLKAKLVKSLIEHFGEDDRRIEHALRVTAWAERILESESGDREIILSVGLLHDVGIKTAEDRGEPGTGPRQEIYGPPIVRRILEAFGLPEDKIDEACAIVGAHHTPAGIPGPNFPILWDADMLVNLRDELPDVDRAKMQSIVEKNFRTRTGLALARREFLPGQPSPAGSI